LLALSDWERRRNKNKGMGKSGDSGTYIYSNGFVGFVEMVANVEYMV
jgi:hypothetical protein